MNLYLLDRAGDRIGYDELSSCVICATDPESARVYASVYAGDEGPDFWLKSAGVQLIGKAEEGVLTGLVCRDFNAG